MEDKNRKKGKIKICLWIALILFLFFSITYALPRLTLVGNKKQIITIGNLKLELKEENEIHITDALPMYDEVGLIQKEEFTFHLINETKNPTNYILKLIETETSQNTDSANKLSKDIVKYGLLKGKTRSVKKISEMETNKNKIDEGTIGGNETIDYHLKFWIDNTVKDNDLIKNKSLSYKIEVEIKQEIKFVADYGKDTSNANPPELTSGMLPVIYDDIHEKWIIADWSKQEKYYNYDRQIWANAVTVTKDVRNEYIGEDGNIKTEKIGQEVPLESMNTWWVWIPRFSYTIKSEDGENYFGKKEEGRKSDPSQSSPGEIDIHFIKKDIIEEGKAQYSNTDVIDNTWRTPDSFTFDEKKLSGFWFAKFELSHKSLSGNELKNSLKCTETKENCESADEIEILPNKYALKENNIANFFYGIKSMQRENNPFGFEKNPNIMDVHMIKPAEWGAIAYLSQSKYGKYGNKNYEEEDKKVKINNCKLDKTGIGATTQDESSSGTDSTSCISPFNAYDGIYGMSASTTGNITGVYDMNGGASEYVMGVLADSEGLPRAGYSSSSTSGFSGKDKDNKLIEGIPFPESKYYTLYKGVDIATACDSGVCYAHALSETYQWYGSLTNLGDTTPWVTFGEDYLMGKKASLFARNSTFGRDHSRITTRATIFSLK